MFNDIVDASLIAVNVREHLTWFLLEPEAEDFVEVTAKSGVQLVLLGHFDEREERVKHLIVFIFEQHLCHVFNIDAKRLSGHKRQLKASGRRVIELRLLNDQLNNLDELFLV